MGGKLFPIFRRRDHLRLTDHLAVFLFFFFNYRYSVVDFLDKNKDNLYQDFKRLLFNRYMHFFWYCFIKLSRAFRRLKLVV